MVAIVSFSLGLLVLAAFSNEYWCDCAARRGAPVHSAAPARTGAQCCAGVCVAVVDSRSDAHVCCHCCIESGPCAACDDILIAAARVWSSLFDAIEGHAANGCSDAASVSGMQSWQDILGEAGGRAAWAWRRLHELMSGVIDTVIGAGVPLALRH